VDVQTEVIPAMKKWTKPHDRYTEIATGENVTTTIAGSRGLLAQIGFDGQIVHTPGHSDDSVSLLLDDGSAFTGDLTLPDLSSEAHAAIVSDSWRPLHALGATTVYPGHGPVYPVSKVVAR